MKQITFVLSFFVLCFPFIVLADGYVSLVGLPGISDPGNINMQDYINSLYRIAIIAAALIAVIKLILAGAKYVLSGIVTDKEQAKRDIYASLIGLLIILAAVTILRTINPEIANLPKLTRTPLYDGLPTKNCDVQASGGCCSLNGGQWIIQSEVGYCNTGGISDTETDAIIVQKMIDSAVEDDQFSEVVELYNLNNIALDQRPNYINNIWPEDCELNADGNSSGNLFTILENNDAGVIAYLCVK